MTDEIRKEEERLFGPIDEDDVMQEEEAADEGEQMVNNMTKKRWDSGIKEMNQALNSEGYWGSMSEVKEETVMYKAVYDDISGQELDASLVLAARAEEMQEFRKHGVYAKFH